MSLWTGEQGRQPEGAEPGIEPPDWQAATSGAPGSEAGLEPPSMAEPSGAEPTQGDGTDIPAMRGPVSPLLTYFILGVLAAAFACEYIFAVVTPERTFFGVALPEMGGVSVETLIALGGLDRDLVAQGQWYRLLMPALLHLNFVHILLNGFCLFLAGRILETLVGRAWLATIFVIGALSGSLASMAINPPNIVSVGASGAIMALFAAIFTVSFRFGATPVRAQLQRSSIGILVPSLLPLGHSAASGQVDIGAHLGGAVAGIALGFLIWRVWPRDALLPGLRRTAAVLAAAGGLAFLVSIAAVAQNYRVFALMGGLMPEREIPKTDAEIASRSAELVARYPNDPRAHYLRGLALMRAHNLKGAEDELRAALAEDEVIRLELTKGFAMGVRGLLAALLYDQGRIEEAKATAREPCASPDTEAGIRSVLSRVHLCD